MRETTHRTTHKVDAVLEEPVHQLDRQQDGEQHDKSQIKLVAEHGHGQARLCDGVPHVLVGVLLICSARVCVCVCAQYTKQRAGQLTSTSSGRSGPKNTFCSKRTITTMVRNPAFTNT